MAARSSESLGLVDPVKPGFWTAPPVPIDDAVWRKLEFRSRMRAWTHIIMRQPPPFPDAAAALYGIKLPAWFAAFYFVFRARNLPLSAELNVKRWIVYNVLFDALGLGATSGPLGMKFNLRWPCEAWWYFLTPGTITAPLVPSLGGVRSRSTVALFVVYISALLRALLAPQIGKREVLGVLAALCALLPFDLMPFFASRGEHYVYQLACLAFPGEQWKFGCRMVQLALWSGAGLAKVGPWFKHVIAFMVPNCVLLSGCIPSVQRLLRQDPPRSHRPTPLCTVLAHAGTASEVFMGWLLLFEPTRKWGVRLVMAFHVYIISMTPIASVFEWNIYTMTMTHHLFGGDEPLEWPDSLSPVLRAFLATALLAVPTIGQLFPSTVPFLMAYRPYAGNWRVMWCVMSKSAAPKLRRLRSFASPLQRENVTALVGDDPRWQEHIDYFSSAAMMSFPSYRPLISIVEELMDRHKWCADDFYMLHHLAFASATLGWSLLSGWELFREPFRAAVQSTCDFAPGECYFVQFEPMGLHERTLNWRVVDVSNGRVVMSGSHAYAELEDVDDPTTLVVNIDKKSM